MKQPKEKDVIAARDRLMELSRIQTEAREEELKIREYLVESLYPKDKTEGSTTITVGATKLTLTVAYRHTISKEDAEKLKIDKPDLYATCLRFTPEVRAGEFKKHEEELSEYIITKPTPPSVSFK